jgi:hypothetical protein
MDKTIGEMLQQLMEMVPEPSEWEQSGFSREMVADSSLAYHLERLTKTELDQIRQYLQVKRASNLRKSDLTAVLAAAIRLRAPQLLELIDEITLDYLQDLVESKGLLRKADEIFVGTLFFLRQSGLAFAGEMSGVGPVLVMPREVLELVAPLLKQEGTRRQARENQKILMAIRGLLGYYGCMEQQQVISTLLDMGFSDLDKLPSLQLGVGVANGYFDLRQGYLCDKRVVDLQVLLERQRAASHLNFFSVGAGKAVAMGEQLYLDWEDEHRRLFDYLQDESGLDDDETSEAVAFFLFAVNNDLPALLLLGEYGKMDIQVSGYKQAAELLNLVEAARRKTRLWVLKGHTPEESEELERRPRLQVLRSQDRQRKH